MSLEVPVSKAGLTQNGDEACRLLQGHDAPQNEEVPLLGIRLPVLRNFAGKKLRRIWQDRMSARCVDPQKGRSSRFYTAETAAGGEAAPFRDAGKDGMPERGLDSVPFRVWNEALTIKTMPNINDNFLKLQAGYLFPEIGRRVNAFAESHPEAAKRLIRCGIGDVTEPLPMAAIEAMHWAVDDLSTHERFHGYGPEQGYFWLREAIAKKAYQAHGVHVEVDEIYVSDGAKCDTGNILDIFGPGNRIAVPDPVYPVYVDTNVMAGNTGSSSPDGSYEGLVYLPCTPENNFVPQLPDEHVDLIYLCFPNNPTGAVASRNELLKWVEYARANRAIILYDSAYEAFIQDSSIPRSIFEIPGARDCAIEFRSFSKQGGFTGVRCGYVVIPKELHGYDSEGNKVSISRLWSRRTSTKFNGASYIVQRGAAALFTMEGMAQTAALISHYLGNASLLLNACRQAGMRVWGGENAPYVWVQCPDGLDSWQMFDKMLHEANVVITPGSGFGSRGEGFFRISAFNSRENVDEVCRRIHSLFAR